MDILPTMPQYVKLEEIIDPNNIVFLSTGKNSESAYQTFPYIIRCIRTREDSERNDDFISYTENKYFKLDEEVATEFGKKGVLSRLVVTLEGVEILFKPVPGDEANFYAAFSDVPATSICCLPDKRQMVLEFKDALVDASLKKATIPVEENPYINSISVEKEGSDANVIDLEDAAKAYTIEKRHLPLPCHLPYISISFTDGRY